MSEFWSLFRQSVIVQAMLALLTTSAILYALLAGMTVPSEMWAMWGLILGWYFGAKGQAGTQEAVRNLATYKANCGGGNGLTPSGGAPA